MKGKIRIRVNNSSLNFLNYLINNKINYYNLDRYKNYYLLDISKDDLSFFDKFDIKVEKYYGIIGIYYFFKNNLCSLIGLFVGLFLLLLLENTIFDVRINTDNENIKNTIVNSLKVNNIDKYKKKKSFEEIQNIKNIILKDNNDILEWIEIVEVGSTYVVEITPRVIGNKNSDNNDPQNIVALKDGLILNLNLEKGVALKDVNDYVKKGDIIISGSIIKDEETIDNIKAEGKVYAEVWYTSKITMPFEYIEYRQTGKIINHYYLSFFGKEMTLLGKYNSPFVFSEKEKIIDKPYLFFDVYKESKIEYKYFNVILNENEAYEEAINKSDTIIKRNLKSEEYIMDKKVLKKEVFSSKMILEVFYKVYEDITDTSGIEEVNNDI